MALDLLKLRAIHGSVGLPSPSETKRQNAVHSVKRDFMKSLDCEKFFIWENGETTEKEVFLNINKKEFSTVVGEKDDFRCLNDVEVYAGMMLYNPQEEIYWLVVSSEPIDGIYRQGILYYCNTVLRWQDKNGNIWNYPTHDINATQYNSGIEQGRNVDYVTSQHKMQTVADNNTLALPVDTRFFIGDNIPIPDVYRLTQNDSSSRSYGKGLTELTVLRDVYNPETDDVTTRLCAVKKNVDQIAGDATGDITFKYSGNPNIIIGRTKTITANIDADTAALSQATWTVEEDWAKPFITIVAEPTDNRKAVVKLSSKSNVFVYENEKFTLVYENGTNRGTIELGIVGGT